MKIYKKAPLPFNGQKKNWIKTFIPIISDMNHDIYVDLFGGSGLLSHTIKALKPNAKVIYNDFDNYSERLRNIGKTNILISDLRKITANIQKEKIILGEARDRILERIEKEEYVDWDTVSASLLFTGNIARSVEDLKKGRLYNNISQSNYESEGYLLGVETVRMDYVDLFEHYKNERAMFIVDPPYMFTDNSRYNNKKYWKIKDYLNIVKILQDIDFIYFTSEKSQILELCDFIETEFQSKNIFSLCKKKEITTMANLNASYKEMILYKINDENTNNLFLKFF
ncbi:MAG: DNA adenine methylase [Prevotellaceae bacterium]|jgi:16S rRNA G966 N2-methylase RsmD|nr:DNA adenine methylase [Prevotellaceae bacterium]